MNYPVTVKWNERMDEFCSRERIYLAHPLRSSKVYSTGESIRFNGPARVERYGTLVKYHFFSIGAFSYANTHLPYDTVIGRYCSIAPRVEVMTAQHPITRFTTSPITYLPRWPGFAKSEFGSDWAIEPFAEMPPAPTIGNDVWIGQDVLIKGGVYIGNGACIAARSVVTKDVEPYAIVGGVPAKLIRYRFEERLRERMLLLRWWQYKFSDLPATDKSNIVGFLDGLERKIQDGLQPWQPGAIEITAALADLAQA